jgi:hypothetical protein
VAGVLDSPVSIKLYTPTVSSNSEYSDSSNVRYVFEPELEFPPARQPHNIIRVHSILDGPQAR